MTQRQQSKWFSINTILTGIATAFTIAGFSMAIKIYNFMIETSQANTYRDAAIIEMKAEIKESKQNTENHENRLTYLEAILPNQRKLSQKK